MGREVGRVSTTEIPGKQTPGPSQSNLPQESKLIENRDTVCASSLLQRIDRLLVQSERYVWLHAISTWLALSLLSLAILVTSDIFFRWQDPGMRWLCWTLWLALTIGSGFWWSRRAWRFVALSKPQRRERMSLQIERLFPKARYEIASAVAFAQQLETKSVDTNASSGETSGSLKLKHESIKRCQQLLTELPIDQAIDHRQPLTQLALFLVLVCTALGVYFLAPSTFSIATQRLLTPWQSLNWPRINQLQFVALPTVIAAGEDLSLRVIDENDQLPTSVQLEVQWPNAANTSERTRSETLDMKIVADAAQLSLPGSSLTPDGAQNKLKLRAKGGDDQSMPWQEIVIAAVPQLKSFSIRIDPPTYSGQASTEVSGQSIRVLSGSRISIRGDWTSTVQSATIERWNIIPSTTIASNSGENGKPTEAITSTADAATLELKNDSSSFILFANKQSFPLAIGSTEPMGIPVYQSTEIAIRWTSVDGIDVVGPKWTIQTIPDRLPTLELIKPLDEQPVTPSATIPLEAIVTDDLGLKDISLHWKWNGSKGTEIARDAEQELLWDENDTDSSASNDSLSLNQKVERTWTIPPTASAQGVTGLTLWVEAKDSADQTAQSKPITLRFTTPEQTLAELAQRQTDIRNKIEQALQQQREAALPVTSGLEVLQQNGELQQQDRDALQSAARNQKNLRTALTQDRNSVKESLESVAEQLNANNLSESDLAKENQALLDRITELDAADLSTAQQAVARASQLANDATRMESSSESRQSLVDQLADSNATQTKIIDNLQQMLDSLSRTESLRQSQSELMDIARKQRELHERTEQLQRSALLAPNSPGLNTERTRIEVAQSELARETERIQQQLRDDSQALKENAPQLAENSAKLASELDAAALSSKMREAKDSVQKNSFDNALKQQQAVMDSMASILDQASQATQPTLDQLEQALSGAQQALSNIADQQQTLSDSIADRNDPSEAKRNEQRESQAKLRSNTEQTAQQLENWLGENSLEDLIQAVEDQQTAESSLQAGNQTEAEQAAQDAANRLQRTAEMLEDMTLEIQQENIADQLQRLRPLVDRLYSEETNLATDSKSSWEQVDQALKDSLANSENIPVDLQQALEQTSREYAARQLALRQLLARAEGDLKILPAFELVTEAILADMDQAVAGFERSQYSDTALPAVDAAQRRLKQLQDAIAETKPQDQESTENQKPENEPADDAQQQPPSRAPLASLKLLRNLQQDLLRETQELSENSPANDLTATQQRRLSQLADLQQKLAEQVENLAKEIGRERDTPAPNSP
jgi:hypothetical protein